MQLNTKSFLLQIFFHYLILPTSYHSLGADLTSHSHAFFSNSSKSGKTYKINIGKLWLFATQMQNVLLVNLN